MAFIAIPVLGLFGFDLINEIQPWALLLNGLTAISAAILFWRGEWSTSGERSSS